MENSETNCDNCNDNVTSRIHFFATLDMMIHRQEGP